MMQYFIGRWHPHKTTTGLRMKTKRSRGALCSCCFNDLCSKLSISSSSSSSSSSIVSSGTEPLQTLSSLAHAMVQERLSGMIDAERRMGDGGWRRRRRKKDVQGHVGGGRVIILVAMDKSSYEPMRDFKDSMMEVICSKGLEEPKDLRSLLNCYISMNPGEQRQAILEAFHEPINWREESYECGVPIGVKRMIWEFTEEKKSSSCIAVKKKIVPALLAIDQRDLRLYCVEEESHHILLSKRKTGSSFIFAV